MTDLEPPVLDGAEVTARARAAYGPDGRPRLPDMTGWDIFPYEGDLQAKPLADPVLPEPPRHGESGADCDACAADDGEYVWADPRWRLRTTAEPQPVPAFLLEPRAHLDLGDLDEAHAEELGRLVVRIERVLAGIPGVARVHVNRWGDGGAHLHVWFFARPAGMLQLRGQCLPDWLDLLPPLPTELAGSLSRWVARQLST